MSKFYTTQNFAKQLFSNLQYHQDALLKLHNAFKLQYHQTLK